MSTRATVDAHWDQDGFAVLPAYLSASDLRLGLSELRLLFPSAEAWAKFTGAADYEQELHRDYLNHTVVVPSDDPRFRNLELFVWLNDVDEGLGPTHLGAPGHRPHRAGWRPLHPPLQLPAGRRRVGRSSGLG